MRTFAGNSSGPLLVGLDMGTTSVKAVIYECDGRTAAQASVPTKTHVPRPGWAYYEPDELWQGAVAALREAVAQIDRPERIAGIAVASMAEAGIPLDHAGKPTSECIAWFDRRTIPQAEWLGETLGEDHLFAVTGLSLQPIFSLCKMLWLKRNEPEVFGRTVRWLNVADFIAFKLSGVEATDWSLASRTLAFDLRKLNWDDEIVDAAGVPRSLFAPAQASGVRIGGVTADAARLTGLPGGAAVSRGGHDHVCGALAAGVVRDGEMLDSMGTAEALFVALDRPLSDPGFGRQGSRRAHTSLPVPITCAEGSTPPAAVSSGYGRPWATDNARGADRRGGERAARESRRDIHSTSSARERSLSRC